MYIFSGPVSRFRERFRKKKFFFDECCADFEDFEETKVLFLQSSEVRPCNYHRLSFWNTINPSPREHARFSDNFLNGTHIILPICVFRIRRFLQNGMLRMAFPPRNRLKPPGDRTWCFSEGFIVRQPKRRRDLTCSRSTKTHCSVKTKQPGKWENSVPPSVWTSIW